jgi:general secretion pathway protein B
MSYILDALKKAEKQRTIGQVPRLGAMHAKPAPTRRRWSHGLLGIALLANALVLALSTWPDTETDKHAQTSMPASEIDPAAASAKPNVPEPVLHPRSQYQTVTQSGLPSVDEAPQTPTSHLSDVQHPLLDATLTAAKPRVVPAHPRSESTQGFGEPRGVVVPAPPPRKAKPVVELSTIPRLKEMPVAFRHSIPPLTIDVHVASDIPDERFVVINMHRYHEGERMQEGPLLEAIVDDGLLLNYQGQRFRVMLAR